MEFTREQTNIAKGIAICLMFANHLYAFKYRLLHGNYYVPLIPFFNAEHYLGNFGSICVAIFLFLSGYGMFLGHLRSKKNVIYYTLTKLKDFYLNYWLYFLIFVPIGIFFFKNVTLWQSSQIRYSTEPGIFLENFLGWSATYNEEWWFVRMFAIALVFLFPLYTKTVEKTIILVVFVSLLLFLIGLKLNPYHALGFLFWQTSFALGIICAKIDLFSNKLVQKLDQFGGVYIFIGLLLCFVLRSLLASGATVYFWCMSKGEKRAYPAGELRTCCSLAQVKSVKPIWQPQWLDAWSSSVSGSSSIT